MKVEKAIAAVRDQLSVINAMLNGCPWREVPAKGGPEARLNAMLKTTDFLCDPANADNVEPKGEHKLPQRFRLAVQRLERFWALCRWNPDVADIAEEVAFHPAVRVALMRADADARKATGIPVRADVETYLRMLTASTIEADGVKDLYALAGIDLPDLSCINEEYLARLRESEHPHLAIEALRRLIDQEMNKVLRHNLVRRTRFSEALEQVIRRYTNQQPASAAVIAELVKMAREIIAEQERGTAFYAALNYAELAFYDAVCDNESAIAEMAGGVLADIARDLVRETLADDWATTADE